jgi:hypothetical protein
MLLKYSMGPVKLSFAASPAIDEFQSVAFASNTTPRGIGAG